MIPKKNFEEFIKSLSMSHPANTMPQNNEQTLQKSNSSSKGVAAALYNLELQNENPEATMETNNDSEIAQESEVIEDTVLDNSSSSTHQHPTQNSEQIASKLAPAAIRNVSLNLSCHHRIRFTAG